MLEDWASYAVEIRARNPGDQDLVLGSGYVVSSGRIVTALHVVVGKSDFLNGLVIPYKEIMIRAYGDFLNKYPQVVDWNLTRVEQDFPDERNPDLLWRPACVIWPSAGGKSPSLDIAVLEVTADNDLRFMNRASPVELGNVTGEVSCRGVGFPKWKIQTSNQGTNYVAPLPLTGNLLSGVPGLGAMHPLQVTSGTPATSVQWEGVSGTAILDTRNLGLLGVVSRADGSFGNSVLQVTMVSDARGKEEFDEFWRASGLANADARGGDTPTRTELFDAVTAFIGKTERGRLTPFVITGWQDFVGEFGDATVLRGSYLAPAVRGFFENGGELAYVMRVVADGCACAIGQLRTEDGSLCCTVTAASPGAWGNNILVSIRRGTRTGLRVSVEWIAELEETDTRIEWDQSTRSIPEDFDNLSLDPERRNFYAKVVNTKSRLIQIGSLAGMCELLRPSHSDLKLSGGRDGVGGGCSSTGNEASDILDRCLPLFKEYFDIGLLCVPDITSKEWNDANRQRVTEGLLKDCGERNRLALLAVPELEPSPDLVNSPEDSRFAAVYFPWINVRSGADGRVVSVPPVGHIAGALARHDRRSGVHGSPLGIVLNGIAIDQNTSACSYALSDDEADNVLRHGINVLLEQPAGSGRVCLSTAVTAAINDEEQLLNILRLRNFICRSLDAGLQWTHFEENNEATWSQVRFRVEEFLLRLWRTGALPANEPTEAFLVRCDHTTMTWDDVMNGRLIVLVRIASSPEAMIFQYETVPPREPPEQIQP